MVMFPRTADATGGFPPLETGWYTLRVLDVRDKKDRNDVPYWAVQFEVVEKTPKQVWDNFRKSEDWLWKLRVFLEAIDPSLTEKEFDSTEIVDKEVVAFITPDGKYDRIKEYADVNQPEPGVPKEQGNEDMPF